MYISNSSFLEKWPEIQQNITSCDFVSCDFEFSSTFEQLTHNPLDTVEQRFMSEVAALTPCCVFQLGITCSTKQPDNTISLQSYHMYVYQKYNKHFQNNQYLTLSTGVLEFLTNHGLNLQTWITEGVSYLTPTQETKLRETLVKEVRKKRKQVPFVSSDEDSHYLTELTSTLTSFAENDALDVLPLKNLSPKQRFLVHNTVQNQYTTWRSFDAEGAYSYDKRIDESRDGQIKNVIGVRLIFDHIIACGKPLVCHGGLGDLVLVSTIFYGLSITSLQLFKDFVSKNFPKVYDTCKITQGIGTFARLSLVEVFKSLVVNNDQQLLFDCDEGDESINKLLSFVNGYQTIPFLEVSCHSAGFDSLLTAIVFSLSKLIILSIGQLNLSGEDYNPDRRTIFAIRQVSRSKSRDLEPALASLLDLSESQIDVYHYYRNDFVFVVKDFDQKLLQSVRDAVSEKKKVSGGQLDYVSNLIELDTSEESRKRRSFVDSEPPLKEKSCSIM
ncbi:hypothetical protein GEMRC1_004637 [Eukaryota sp. GEM-RC1]